MNEVLAVGAGGAIGAVCRFLLGAVIPRQESGFPLGTFLINLIGAFAIGLVTVLAVKYSLPGSKWVLFAKTGICGGFTTFSTFSLESFELIRSGRISTALIYMCLSLVLGVCAVLLAEKLVG